MLSLDADRCNGLDKDISGSRDTQNNPEAVCAAHSTDIRRQVPIENHIGSLVQDKFVCTRCSNARCLHELGQLFQNHIHIIVQTRDRSTCRAHEFSSASGHSAHSWACRPVRGDTDKHCVLEFLHNFDHIWETLRHHVNKHVSRVSASHPGHRLAGCQGSKLIHLSPVRHILGICGVDKVKLHSLDQRHLEFMITIATVRTATIDARSVRSTCVHGAIVNISVETDERKIPSGFAVCFKRRLVDPD